MRQSNIWPRLAALAFLIPSFSFAWPWDRWSRSDDRPPPRHYDDYDRPPPRHYDDYDRPRDSETRHDRESPRNDNAVRPASAPKGYVLSGAYTAKGGVEAGNPAKKPVKTVRLFCVSGSVVINTMVVREGTAKTPIPVLARLSPGQWHEIPLPNPRSATGFRFGTSGGGVFQVFVH